MKKVITNYSFNKTTKQITFNDYTLIDIDNVLLITNVTSNIIIYNFAVPGYGGTVSGNVLTLNYDTSAMNNTDGLQIYYEDIAYQEATSQNQDLLNNLTLTIIELASRLEVLAGMANSGAPGIRAFIQNTLTTSISGNVTLNNPTIADQLLSGGVPLTPLVRQQGNLTAELANVVNAKAN